MEFKEKAGLKDTVELEVKKGEAESKRMTAAERDKAMALAHDKYVQAIEVARKEYVEAKKRIYPEMFRPSPEEQEETIRELQERVKLLEKQLKEGAK